MTMENFEKAAWIAETRRLFEALVVEADMVANDTKALQRRVMDACLEAIGPPDPVEPEFIPPEISVKAERASVKEG